MRKKLFYLIVLLLLCLAGVYAYGVYENNREVAMPDRQALGHHYEQSVQWLLNNEESILNQSNGMLWWMLHEAGKMSKDRRIQLLVQKYHQHNRRTLLGVWAPLFDKPGNKYLDSGDVAGLPYYNQHFIYALNCAGGIAEEIELVAQQNDPGFCYQPSYLYRPACITHQLMGINFLYMKRCDLLDNVDEVIQSLQQDIVTQMTWDIRVIDVYLQRVMLLLITGAEASVKPVWIQQILDQQQPDGGWSAFQGLIELSPGRSLGLSPRVVSIGQEQSNFHTTAQGVLILSYLLNR